jgi:hypothetical protein
MTFTGAASVRASRAGSDFTRLALADLKPSTRLATVSGVALQPGGGSAAAAGRAEASRAAPTSRPANRLRRWFRAVMVPPGCGAAGRPGAARWAGRPRDPTCRGRIAAKRERCAQDRSTGSLEHAGDWSAVWPASLAPAPTDLLPQRSERRSDSGMRATCGRKSTAATVRDVIPAGGAAVRDGASARHPMVLPPAGPRLRPSRRHAYHRVDDPPARPARRRSSAEPGSPASRGTLTHGRRLVQ